MLLQSNFIVFIVCFPYLLVAQNKRDTTLSIDSVNIIYHTNKIIGDNNLTFDKKEIKFVPKFFGIEDPLKALKYLPGFGNGGDANAGVYFRGLGSGNNGYYLNGIQIHNPTHFLGLFPAFNTEAIKEVRVFHTNPPGNFSGKVSTYIDIQSNWDIRDTTHYNLDVSLFHLGLGVRTERASKQMIELQARKTFMNQILWPYIKSIMDDSDAINYDLYDVNLNAKQDFGKHQLKLIFYHGQDAASLTMFDDNVRNDIYWGNTIVGLEHDHSFNDQFKLTSRINNSLYNVNVKLDIISDDLSFRNKQNSSVLSNILHWKKNTTHLETGYSLSMETTNPNNLHPDDTLSNIIIEPSNALYFRYFAIFKRKWFENWESTFSLGYNNYKSLKNQQYKPIQYIEPQVKLSFIPLPLFSLYASYSKTYQPIHHVPLTSISIPVDIWLSNSHNIRPMKMHQIVGGVKYSKHNRLEFSLDSYYRAFTNAYEFNGNIIELNRTKNLEETLYRGKGISYGVDFFLKMVYSKYYILTNYSYARSFRKLKQINQGQWYPFIYDRPHNANMLFHFIISSRLSASASFTLSSGSNYTPHVARYFFNNNIINEYGNKNSTRTDTYHRLDGGINYKLSNSSRIKQEIGFNIINLYNRKNAIYHYATIHKSRLEEEGVFEVFQKKAWVLPILPSISYSLKL